MTANEVDQVFQRDEATATLPLVRQIVADIQRDNRALEKVLPRLKDARIRSRREGASVPELEGLRLEVAEITTRFEACLAELAQVGCAYRGSTGHVDFKSEEGGRAVFLCWSPDESTVAWSHAAGLDCRYRSPVESHLVLPVSGL
jgi:hypothetical protein